MDPTLWNVAFTNLLRQSTGAAWGNWTLDPGIKAGAVGIVDPTTGSFTPVGTIPNAKIIPFRNAQSWSVESASTHKTITTIDFKGGYKDPTSGTEVNSGLQVGWSFARAGSIISNGTMIGRSQVDSFGELMIAQFDWLQAQAKSVSFATSDGIAQGFGLITQVNLCSGGANVGSAESDSTFSITGSVDGINALTGGGSVSGSVAASYKDYNETKSVDWHLWPSTSDTTTPDAIAISYQFASFYNKLVMPTWIQPLTGFSINFDNAHGGTYIGRCTVTYNIPSTKALQTQNVTVSGGYNRSISGIPLDATNIQVVVDFEAGDKFRFQWPAPLGTWLTGQKTIDMGGVWPWGSHATVRT